MYNFSFWIFLSTISKDKKTFNPIECLLKDFISNAKLCEFKYVLKIIFCDSDVKMQCDRGLHWCIFCNGWLEILLVYAQIMMTLFELTWYICC